MKLFLMLNLVFANPTTTNTELLNQRDSTIQVTISKKFLKYRRIIKKRVINAELPPIGKSIKKRNNLDQILESLKASSDEGRLHSTFHAGDLDVRVDGEYRNINEKRSVSIILAKLAKAVTKSSCVQGHVITGPIGDKTRIDRCLNIIPSSITVELTAHGLKSLMKFEVKTVLENQLVPTCNLGSAKVRKLGQTFTTYERSLHAFMNPFICT